jgi:teichuronic acid biosynthesis glycosyltransferase TuaC
MTDYRLSTIRVLSVSTLFPNEAQPRHGIFLRHRLTHLAQVEGIEILVVAPVPWFPSARRVFGRYSVFRRAPDRSHQSGLSVLHPRYIVIPKPGMSIAPALMAAALLPVLWRIKRHSFDFDAIDSYYLYPDGVAATLLGLIFNRPVLMTALGSDVNLLPRYVAPRKQILWALGRSAAATAVCQALKKGLIELGAAETKVQVVLHGVDHDLFKPPANRTALRRQIGFDRPTFISVGHLIPRKGHDIAIAALVDVPHANLVIVGDGPEESNLRQLAIRRAVDDRVRFLGHIDQTKLVPLLGAADALVLCSDREGIANVLIEALSCGTPVIATPVWGSPEVVSAPEAGILVGERSVGAVVEGMYRLLAHPPDRDATRRFSERFSWSDAATQHATIIRSAVRAHRNRRN